MTTQIAQLGDVIAAAESGFASGQEIIDGLAQVRMNNVARDGELDWSSIRRVPADSIKGSRFLLSPGDIIFNSTNSPELVGKSALFNGFKEPLAYSNHFLRLRVHRNKADPAFISYWLHYSWRQNLLQRLATRWVNQAAIRKDDLFDLKLVLPTLDEQRTVINRLNEAALLRRMRRYALQMCDEIIAAAFLNIFGDPIANPSGFDLVLLEDDLQRIESGFSPVCEGPRDSAVQWAVLGLGAVTTGIFKPEENKRLPANVAPRPELEVQDGDLLVTRKNTYDLVAACAYVRNPPPRLLLPDTIFRFRLKQNSQLSPVFLWGLLSFPSFRRSVQLLASGSAGSMPGISKEKFMTIRCPVPPVVLQEKFSDVARRHEHLRATHVEALRQADHLFQTLLHQAFSSQ